MKFLSPLKIATVTVLALALAACSSNSGLKSGAEDASFTNQSLLDSGKSYNGFTVAELRSTQNVVYFDFDQYEPKAESLALLQAHAEFIKATGAKVLLEGYADEVGTPNYNITLGGKRARAVLDYLLSQGVSQANIRTISYGEDNPAVLGHNEAAYAKNRRVVLNYSF